MQVVNREQMSMHEVFNVVMADATVTFTVRDDVNAFVASMPVGSYVVLRTFVTLNEWELIDRWRQS